MTDSPKVLTAEEALKLAREIVGMTLPLKSSWGYDLALAHRTVAQALIERLEPVKIKKRGTPEDLFCGACGSGMAFGSERWAKFCPNCGKEIQWT